MSPANGTYTLPRARTGIEGFDEITHGGLPAGRPTLVCGGPGCGKSVLAMEFLVRGAREFDEPGLFVSFEERPPDLVSNFKSMDFDLEDLARQGVLHILYVPCSGGDILEAGRFSLDGLFVRLEMAIEKIGAKRVALDLVGALFTYLSDHRTLRSEIARLFNWLRERELSTVITGEKGDKTLTRYGLEEYVSDCVIFLDHRIQDQVSKRRLRVLKYRGASHVKDELPFLIGSSGLSVLPLSGASFDRDASLERVPTGVPDLDEMLGARGYFRGSSILVSGTAGTGKSSLAAAFANAACRRGESCLYLAFEESRSQIVRNMRSLGMDLAPWEAKGLLYLHSFPTSVCGLEEHLVSISRLARDIDPQAIVIDPITGFENIGGILEVKSMLLRALSNFRSSGATVLMTSLTSGDSVVEYSEADIASLMDTWIVLRQSFEKNQRTRTVYVVKSRGMKHAEDARRYILSSEGVTIRPFPAAAGEATT